MTTDQIAAEAWKHITESGASSDPATYIAIIKFAIEKAYKTGYVQREKDIQSLRDSFEKAGYPQSRAAHASDGGVCPECGTAWPRHRGLCGGSHASDNESTYHLYPP